MKICTYKYYNVYYDKHEQKSADEFGKKLINKGYRLEEKDSGEPFDFCDQYVKIAFLNEAKSRSDSEGK